ncbi:hypothetical protein FC07_GL002908 [Loigolactobacillus bifermentans DSM 20003]|uniref:Uncharacterized protein n=1 Tax=Loigolactobacillus bifermentans DSM 20003 TaxID=1423726 RepID=A0A0R1GTT6_9LACO|nr:hypothetical protein FC07_GL002908 [Loigolactobacillus bifermentans DSM 20003]
MLLTTLSCVVICGVFNDKSIRRTVFRGLIKVKRKFRKRRFSISCDGIVIWIHHCFFTRSSPFTQSVNLNPFDLRLIHGQPGICASIHLVDNGCFVDCGIIFIHRNLVIGCMIGGINFGVFLSNATGVIDFTSCAMLTIPTDRIIINGIRLLTSCFGIISQLKFCLISGFI